MSCYVGHACRDAPCCCGGEPPYQSIDPLLQPHFHVNAWPDRMVKFNTSGPQGGGGGAAAASPPPGPPRDAFAHGGDDSTSATPEDRARAALARALAKLYPSVRGGSSSSSYQAHDQALIYYRRGTSNECHRCRTAPAFLFFLFLNTSLDIRISCRISELTVLNFLSTSLAALSIAGHLLVTCLMFLL